MRFFLYLNPQTPGPEHDAALVDSITQQAVEAEAAGFEAVCLTEHHFSGYNTYGNAFMYGSYLAARLQRACIILTVAVAPLHNPLKLAEQVNLLDLLAKGRAVVGIGAGGSPFEFSGFGRDPADRHALTEQVVDLMLQAWAKREDDPPLQYVTPFDRGVMQGRIMPAAYRQPHPLLARGVVSDSSLLRTAERGWPVFWGRMGVAATGQRLQRYREALVGAGHSAATIAECLRWTMIQKTVYLAETDAQALAECQEPVANLGRLSAKAFGGQAADAAGVRALDEVTKQAMLGHAASDSQGFIEAATLIGSPDTVAAQIQQYADVGIEQMALHFTWGYNDLGRVQRSFRLFVDAVLPRFARGSVGSSAGAGAAAPLPG